MKRWLLLALLVAACSKPAPAPAQAKKAAVLPPPPAAAAAQQLIANAPEFGDYKFTNAAFSIAQKKSMMSPPMMSAAKKLAAKKWLRFDGDTVTVAREDKRILVRPNGFIDVVPLAKKEMIAMTSVKQQPDGVVLADFTWKWVPNELGTAIGQPPTGEQNATAKLMWDGSEWMVLSIM